MGLMQLQHLARSGRKAAHPSKDRRARGAAIVVAVAEYATGVRRLGGSLSVSPEKRSAHLPLDRRPR